MKKQEEQIPPKRYSAQYRQAAALSIIFLFAREILLIGCISFVA